MKSKKEIKERIKALEIVKMTEDRAGSFLCDVKMRQLYWVLNEQSGPVDFGELTS